MYGQEVSENDEYVQRCLAGQMRDILAMNLRNGFPYRLCGPALVSRKILRWHS